MKDKILFVGGTFDERGGEESKIVNEFSKYLDNVDLLLTDDNISPILKEKYKNKGLLIE